LRALPPGRHVGHARARRPRARARDRAPPRRAARRYRRRAERGRRQGRHLHRVAAADARALVALAGICLKGAMPRRGLAIPIVLVLLCVLGFVLRTGNAATVFVGDAVVLAENDPYYHLRRVVLILADSPHVPLFDPWIDYPHGAPIVFAPLFDFALATLARLAGPGVGEHPAVARVAA